MGLFDKKYCDVCGEKIGLLGNRKLEDGNLCKNCAKKLSHWFSERRHSSVDEIKAQLAYREENRKKVSEFHVAHSFGDNRYVLFDDGNRWFTVSKTSSPNESENPDILDYSAVTGYRFDIDENRTEIYHQNKEGRNESYNPPRYKYSYNFDFVINVDNPYFDEIKFRLNCITVNYEPMPTVSVSLFGRSVTDSGMNPENCPRDMGQSICDEFNRIRGIGDVSAPSVQTVTAVADNAAWNCANCGTSNSGKFCEGCGSPKPTSGAVCPGCGWTPTSGGALPKFCPECGTQISR